MVHAQMIVECNCHVCPFVCLLYQSVVSAWLSILLWSLGLVSQCVGFVYMHSSVWLNLKDEIWSISYFSPKTYRYIVGAHNMRRLFK